MAMKMAATMGRMMAPNTPINIKPFTIRHSRAPCFFGCFSLGSGAFCTGVGVFSMLIVCDFYT